MIGMVLKLGTVGIPVMTILGWLAFAAPEPATAVDTSLGRQASATARVITPGVTTESRVVQQLGVPRFVTRVGHDDFWVYRLDTIPALVTFERIQSGQVPGAGGTVAPLAVDQIAILQFSAETKILKLAYGRTTGRP